MASRLLPSLQVFVVISEGELYEGSTWEALLIASHYKLNNLVIIVDVNSLIILGKTKDCLSLDPIDKKFKSFGYKTLKCDGHDFKSIIRSLNVPSKNLPKCILARTTKGKGFSIMENKAHWHYWNKISSDQTKALLEEGK